MDQLVALLETVLGAALLLAFLVAIGWVAGRILGVRRGFWRAAVAGLVGYLAGNVLLAVQHQTNVVVNDLGDVSSLGAGYLGFVLLVTMLTSIVLEVLLRPRDRRRRGLPRPVKTAKRQIATLGRVRDIAGAARRNGLVRRRFASPAALSTPEGARALRLTLEQSGGMLVKFGQIASTREDLLPATVTQELSHLRASVPPLPVDVVREQIEAELGAPVEELFASFSDAPLAAASIGVTHEAVLRDGRRVIVKVQRPGVDDQVAQDGRVLTWSARQLEARSDSAARLGVADLADELVTGIREELDFTREAANNAAMLRARATDPGIGIPEVIRPLTTRRVLVMDAVRGRAVDDAAAVDATGVPRAELAENLLRSFLGQVLQDGVYHADPHPGNILIDTAGTLWFIDYGAVGHVDPVTLEALQQLAFGFVLRDPSMLARAVRRMAGADGEDLDIAALEFELGIVVTELQGGGFDPHALGEVVRVLGHHGVRAPRSLTVLGRAVLTLDGTLRTIDPTFRMGPEAQKQIVTILGAAESDPQQLVLKEVVRSMPSLRTLPQLTEDLALQARSGRLALRLDRFSGPDGDRMQFWLYETLFAVLGMVGLVGSALLLIASGMAGNADVQVYLRFIGFTGLVVSTAMQMRVVARILNSRNGADRV